MLDQLSSSDVPRSSLVDSHSFSRILPWMFERVVRASSLYQQSSPVDGISCRTFKQWLQGRRRNSNDHIRTAYHRLAKYEYLLKCDCVTFHYAKSKKLLYNFINVFDKSLIIYLDFWSNLDDNQDDILSDRIWYRSSILPMNKILRNAYCVWLWFSYLRNAKKYLKLELWVI